MSSVGAPVRANRARDGLVAVYIKGSFALGIIDSCVVPLRLFHWAGPWSGRRLVCLFLTAMMHRVAHGHIVGSFALGIIDSCVEPLRLFHWAGP